MPAPQPALDHLILFLPAHPTAPMPVAPLSLRQNFTLSPGGTHADGLTANTLISLADGCYIELITFLAPPAPTASTEHAAKIQNHWWGPSPHRTGWADWCLTNALAPAANHAHLAASHAPPVAGARVRPDGVKVEWAVTFPQGERGGQARRGLVPFFCHDVTPRALRVPSSPKLTAHACGAVGVKSLTVLVDSEARLDEVRGAYAAVFGEAESAKGGEQMLFETFRVIGDGTQIVVRVAKGEEMARVKDRGFWVGDVVLTAKAGQGKEKGTKERIDAEEDGIGGLWVEYT